MLTNLEGSLVAQIRGARRKPLPAVTPGCERCEVIHARELCARADDLLGAWERGIWPYDAQTARRDETRPEPPDHGVYALARRRPWVIPALEGCTNCEEPKPILAGDRVWHERWGSAHVLELLLDIPPGIKARCRQMTGDKAEFQVPLAELSLDHGKPPRPGSRGAPPKGCIVKSDLTLQR